MAQRTVAKWESLQTGTSPWPATQAILDRALSQADPDTKRRFEALIGKATPARSGELTTRRHRDMALDVDYIESLHRDIESFVRLDQKYGGAVTSPLTVQAFRQARHRITTSNLPDGLARDAYAAVAETAEVAGWCLYDADEHDHARRMNRVALTLAGRAGDRSMELFLLQNMSMHASHLGYAHEALDLARQALEATLTPRLRSLFRLREARALAELGADTDAHNTFRLARNLHAEGVSDRDPHWAWWLDDAEFAWHEGKIHLSLDNPTCAMDSFDLAAEGTRENHPRGSYIHQGSAFVVHVINQSWPDAERSMRSLLNHTGLVGSRRGDRTVEEGLDLLDHTTPPSTITDMALALRQALASTI
ncbi:XRE family transcriptional regulator [Actinokineospora inagensis]|uniref:XRE family transcriptional regulator n=1 Tax=Actinokineospora inagensis TaxID=103730 RepID=UPI00146F9C40|nr:XRE family transcriptional regulator [Actinokineospora inagensis]